ncbi:hypothetical protein BKA64DRAFT_642610 [Cadophora sp. MPI-SDFR-AT-0126]|nr:hypothetical protein BKA64DRAFT_642610 [Leotiomycetes sp. MPI-SDFR-AT-0126]
MTRNILLSGPPEIVVGILIECQTFPDLISVILTTKYVHSIWLSNMSTIIWQVGRSALPAFEYALLAVRATNLVRNAVREGRTPPNPLPIHELCSKPQQAQLSELNDLLNFQHLVKCVEHMCVTSEDWGIYPSGYMESITEEIARVKSPSEVRVWRERFYRAMYRTFFAGAVFYGAYNEPFSSSASRPEGVPRECLRKYDPARDPATFEYYDWSEPIFPPESSQYLQRFLLYNNSAPDEQEQSVFDAFAEWIVEDGKRLASANQCRPFLDLDSSQVSGVWELMAMLCAYQLLMVLQPKFANGNGRGGYGHWHDRHYEDTPDEAFWDLDWRPARQEIPGETREVTVILFGVFGLEDITMPVVVEDTSESNLLIANPSHLLKDSADPILDPEGAPQNVDIYSLQQYMFAQSGLPNHNDEHEMCPLDFKLFKFILKTRFGLQFGNTTFDHIDKYRFWESFVKCAAIFYPPDSGPRRYGFEVLATYEPRKLSYKPIKYYIE